MSFIAANKVYTSTNKTTIVWIETELFFLPGVDASHVYVRALALGCFYSHISTRTFRRALTASLEIKSAPSVSGVTKSGRVWRKVPKAMLGVWVGACSTDQISSFMQHTLLLRTVRVQGAAAAAVGVHVASVPSTETTDHRDYDWGTGSPGRPPKLSLTQPRVSSLALQH